MVALNQHANGIWGSITEEDFLANENAFLTGGRLFSVAEVLRASSSG